MEPQADPARWKQRAVTLIGAVVFVLLLAGLGVYTFVVAVSTKLHPNPADIPSVAVAEP